MRVEKTVFAVESMVIPSIYRNATLSQVTSRDLARLRFASFNDLLGEWKSVTGFISLPECVSTRDAQLLDAIESEFAHRTLTNGQKTAITDWNTEIALTRIDGESWEEAIAKEKHLYRCRNSDQDDLTAIYNEAISYDAPTWHLDVLKEELRRREME